MSAETTSAYRGSGSWQASRSEYLLSQQPICIDSDGGISRWQTANWLLCRGCLKYVEATKWATDIMISKGGARRHFDRRPLWMGSRSKNACARSEARLGVVPGLGWN